MSRRTLAILLVVSIVLLAGVLAVWALTTWERRFGEQFVILEAKRPNTAPGAFLTEDDALAIANSAMEAAGYPTDQWLVVPDDRTQAPDGRPDGYFVRNSIDPHRGTFMFRNDAHHDGWFRDLFVTLDREEGNLRVLVYRGK